MRNQGDIYTLVFSLFHHQTLATQQKGKDSVTKTGFAKNSWAPWVIRLSAFATRPRRRRSTAIPQRTKAHPLWKQTASPAIDQSQPRTAQEGRYTPIHPATTHWTILIVCTTRTIHPHSSTTHHPSPQCVTQKPLPVQKKLPNQ